MGLKKFQWLAVVAIVSSITIAATVASKSNGTKVSTEKGESTSTKVIWKDDLTNVLVDLDDVVAMKDGQCICKVGDTVSMASFTSNEDQKGTVLVYDDNAFHHLEAFVLLSSDREFTDIPPAGIRPDAFRGFELVFHYSYTNGKALMFKKADEWVMNLRQISNYNRVNYIGKKRKPYTDFKVAVERLRAAGKPLNSEIGFDLVDSE